MPGIQQGYSGVALETISTITVGTAAVQCVASPGQLCGSAYIEADAANTAGINVGDVNVSTTRFMTILNAVASGTNPGTTQKGIWLFAPDPSKPGASNLNLGTIYFVSSAAGQKVHVTYFERMGG
jgi:hypothetical protein